MIQPECFSVPVFALFVLFLVVLVLCWLPFEENPRKNSGLPLKQSTPGKFCFFNFSRFSLSCLHDRWAPDACGLTFRRFFFFIFFKKKEAQFQNGSLNLKMIKIKEK